MPDVCLLVEHDDTKLKKTTLNALTFCRQAAAHLSGRLHLLILGRTVAPVVEDLMSYGASCIWVAEHPDLTPYAADTWAPVAADASRTMGASLLAMPSGSTAKDLMPRIAARLSAGMASDVVGFDGRLFTRPMWAASVLARVEVMTDTKVVSVQPTAFDAAEPTGGRSAVSLLKATVTEGRTRFVELRSTPSQRPDLTEARVVVSGGRGLDTATNFRLLEELADLLGGAVGATRAAVDAGWVPNDLQVGQTGKIVAPELYVAVGLSGSTQHKAGMKNSRSIVAINKDEEAPIFEIADYGLVADLFEALPALTKALRKEKGLS